MKYFLIFPFLIGLSIIILPDSMAEEQQVYMQIDNKTKKLYYTGSNINSAVFDMDSSSVVFQTGKDASLNVKMPKAHKHGEQLFSLKNGEEVVPKSLEENSCFYFATFELENPSRLELLVSYWPEQHTELTDDCETFDASPLTQTHMQIPLDEIKCKQGLVLIQKNNGIPACVSFEAKEKLLQRNWAVDFQMMHIIDNSYWAKTYLVYHTMCAHIGVWEKSEQDMQNRNAWTMTEMDLKKVPIIKSMLEYNSRGLYSSDEYPVTSTVVSDDVQEQYRERFDSISKNKSDNESVFQYKEKYYDVSFSIC